MINDLIHIFFKKFFMTRKISLENKYKISQYYKFKNTENVKNLYFTDIKVINKILCQP